VPTSTRFNLAHEGVGLDAELEHVRRRAPSRREDVALEAHVVGLGAA
jgi:hypothetical protein